MNEYEQRFWDMHMQEYADRLMNLIREHACMVREMRAAGYEVCEE